MSESTSQKDFEFERRFFVRSIPSEFLDWHSLIVQTYFVAKDGYALRIRLSAPGRSNKLDLKAPSADALERYATEFDSAVLTVKGPAVSGTRYEVERDLDVATALALCRAGGTPLAKHRYSIWLGEDGWSIDVFGGANYPLILAECEREGPVTNLEIPEFCATEVTSDPRFSNDSLAVAPYCRWQHEFLEEFAREGPNFQTEFGENR